MSQRAEVVETCSTEEVKEKIASLEMKQLDPLTQAIFCCDQTAFVTLVDEVDNLPDEIADDLRTLVSRFEYEKMLDLMGYTGQR